MLENAKMIPTNLVLRKSDKWNQKYEEKSHFDSLKVPLESHLTHCMALWDNVDNVNYGREY